jgi:death-on-curing protein
MATFGGELLHKDLVEIAAAYLFYLVCDHPCVDGNKRIGLAAALAFLRRNKHPVTHGTESLYALTMLVANGQLTKQQVTDHLRAIIDAPEAP